MALTGQLVLILVLVVQVLVQGRPAAPGHVQQPRHGTLRGVLLLRLPTLPAWPRPGPAGRTLPAAASPLALGPSCRSGASSLHPKASSGAPSLPSVQVARGPYGSASPDGRLEGAAPAGSRRCRRRRAAAAWQCGCRWRRRRRRRSRWLGGGVRTHGGGCDGCGRRGGAAAYRCHVLPYGGGGEAVRVGQDVVGVTLQLAPEKAREARASRDGRCKGVFSQGLWLRLPVGIARGLKGQLHLTIHQFYVQVPVYAIFRPKCNAIPVCVQAHRQCLHERCSVASRYREKDGGASRIAYRLAVPERAVQCVRVHQLPSVHQAARRHAAALGRPRLGAAAQEHHLQRRGARGRAYQYQGGARPFRRGVLPKRAAGFSTWT